VNKTEQHFVLLLDDDVCLTTLVKHAFRRHLTEVELLVARTIEEAQMYLAEYAIQFFILDVNLPDGSGLDFLADIRTIFPEAKAMILTATPLPQYRQQSRDMGALLFREKPVDPKELVEVVRTKLVLKEETVHLHAKDGRFAVSLTCLSAMDIIQLKCLSSATLALQFTAPQGGGKIYFESGEIVHAEAPGQTGEQAIETILRWRGGKIAELPEERAQHRTIMVSWQGLLLNVAQRIDEASAVAAT
jgi:DNA-binding response OmpR family regulator